MYTKIAVALCGISVLDVLPDMLNKALESQPTKTQQLNVRLTAATMAALQRVGVREDRTRSYLVNWFVQWGLDKYSRVGSLAELKSTKIVTSKQSVILKEVQKAAQQRLELRREAATNVGKAGKGSLHRSTRKANSGL